MTIREQIQERIAKLDEAVLPAVLRELDFLEERHKREFSQEFLEMMNTPTNNTMTGEEALKLATEAVKEVRQEQHP